MIYQNDIPNLTDIPNVQVFDSCGKAFWSFIDVARLFI